MAIKGKKKSQSRGAQGVRRPAQAPRPAPAPRRHTPWYRTRDGMMIGGIVLVVLLGVVIWAIAGMQQRAQEAEDRRAAIDRYTDQVRAAMEAATPTVTDMNLVATPPRGDAAEEVANNAADWAEALRGAQTQVVQIFPDRELESVNQLFNTTLSLYISSAQTFALLPDIEGDARLDVFSRAADQRDTASAMWASTIGVLDQLRRENDMSASGMRAPVPEAPEMEMPEAPEGEEPAAPEDAEGSDSVDTGTEEGADENDDGVPADEDDGGGGG